MFEGILEKILQSRLGEYIEGLDRKNLSIGVWSGNILIENAKIRVKAFEKYKLPFRIKFGKIARLKATVPWASLSSSPVEIILDSLMVILVSKQRSEWEIVDQIGKNFKKEILADFAESLLDSIRKGNSEDENNQAPGFLERLTMKILDNIQIKINNIHIRYEVNFEGQGFSRMGLSLGLKLEQLYIVTTDDDWNMQFFDRTWEENKNKPIHKLLALSNLWMYSDSSDTWFFSKIYESEEEMTNAFSREDKSKIGERNWILKPISLNAKFKKCKVFNDELPKYWIELIVDDFSLNLKKKELLNLIKIMEFITEYRKFQDSYNRTLKYKFLRPYYEILDTDKDPKVLNYNVNPNARLWWKYVVEWVRRIVKMRNGAPNQFKLSNQAKEALGTQFKYYFSKMFTYKQDTKSKFDNLHGGENKSSSETSSQGINPEILKLETAVLDVHERNHYDYILTAIDLPTLKQWASIVVKKYHEKDKQFEERRKSKSSSLWSYFSWASSEPEDTNENEDFEQSSENSHSDFHITPDQVEEINKIIQNNLEGISEEDLKEQNLMFEIHYACLKGEFYIEDDTDTKSSGITIKYEDCKFDIRKKVSREFEFLSSMKSLTADLFWQQSSKSDHKVFLPLVRNGVEKPSEISKIEDDNVYELIISRNKAGSVVDLEFDFVIKPIYFYYRALMLKIIKSFTSLGANSSEELKIKAWDKIDEVRGNASNKIKGTLLTTTNTVSGLIQSPKLILPFSQNNDINTPAYVLCLGTLNLSRDKDNAFSKSYHYLNVSIKGTQLQYFESLLLWQKYEVESLRQSLADDKIFNGLNEKVFNVIEELEIYFKVGKKRKSDELNAKDYSMADLTLDGKVSDIRVNMTSKRYNSLINFNKMIEITGKNLTSKIMLYEKQDILNNSTKMGMIRKRGATIEYWSKQFAVLSGFYLYFYNEDIDNSDTYESYFYLKDAVVNVYEDEELGNVFSIMNDQYDFFIYVQDEETMKSWIKELHNKIYDINNIVDDFGTSNALAETQSGHFERGTIKDRPEANLISINLTFEKLEYTMINDNYSKFLRLKLNEMNLSSNSLCKVEVDQDGNIIAYDKKYSTIIDIDIKKIKITDIENKLVIAESFQTVYASIKILDKSSKFYQGDSLTIEFNFERVAVNFLPESIKKMVAFLKDTEYKEYDPLKSNMSKNYSRSYEESKEDRNSDRFSKTFKKDDIAKDNFDIIGSKSIMKLLLSFKTTNFVWVNPNNKNPLVVINAENLQPIYEQRQGVHQLDITCTNMPVTCVSPIFGTFDLITMNVEDPQNYQTKAPFDLHCEFYKEGVEIDGKKVPNKIILSLDEISLFYQQENVFRIKDYFFEQFLDAITGGTVPETNSEKFYPWDKSVKNMLDDK